MSATGKTDGFSLLELMVVLAILSLLTLAIPLALPHLVPKYQLNEEAESLAATLRSHRATAVALGHPLVLEIIDSGSEQRILNGNSGDAIWRPSYGTTLSLRWDGVHTGERLSFYADGSSSGATLALSLADRVRKVRVSPLTGRVDVLDP